MARPYPLWFPMPKALAQEFCETRDEFLSVLEKMLHLFDEDEDAWREWSGARKVPEERELLMAARYFARAEPQRMKDAEKIDLNGCPAIEMVHVKVEVPRDIIPLLRKAGMRVEGQIYHALGIDDDDDDDDGPKMKRFPTEKLPNVVRFFYYMYRSGRLVA